MSNTEPINGRSFTLTPLNLQSLRKQLLEYSQVELDSDSENDKSDEENTPKVKCENEILHPENEECNETNITKPSEKQHNTISLSNHLSCYESSLETVLEETGITNQKDRDLIEKENIPILNEPLNLSKGKAKNDSFDLDFSALCVPTPVKRKDIFTTPKINIIPPSETKSLKNSVHYSVTAKVSNFEPPLSIAKPLLKTPISKSLNNQYSAKKLPVTPYQALKKSTVLFETPKVAIPQTICGSRECNEIVVNNKIYIIISLLGKGGSSEVYCCFNAEEQIYVAIKIVSLTDPTTVEGYINEVKMLKSLQDCNRIIKMYDYEIQDDKLMVVLEKGGKDLSTILKQLANKKSCLPNYKLFFYWMEMLYAVKQIHENGIIHSDLKPANFINIEQGLKLIDFGIASKVQGDMSCVYKLNQEGSCHYISPEALSTQNSSNPNSPSYRNPKYKIHFKSDVWSLGCILYQLVYNETPFQHLYPIWAKLSAIINPNHKINFPKADWVSPKIINTIKKCLQHDIKLRPSIDELIEEYEKMLRNV